jgi:hypothetical protein
VRNLRYQVSGVRFQFLNQNSDLATGYGLPATGVPRSAIGYSLFAIRERVLTVLEERVKI